jgi:hypothetical protein
VIIEDIGLCIQIAPGEVLLGDAKKNIFVRIPCKMVKGVVGKILSVGEEAEKLNDLTNQVEKLIHENNNGDVIKV